MSSIMASSITDAQIADGSYQYRFLDETRPATGSTISINGNTLSESRWGGAAVTISLSPEASAALTRSAVAVALLSDGKSSAPTSDQSTVDSKQPAATATQTGSTTTASTSSSNTIASDTETDAQYLAALKAQLWQNPMDVLTDVMNQFGGAASWMNALNPAETESFVAAYNSGSLQIQSTDARPELGYSANATYSGGGMTTSGSQNDNIELAEDAATNTYSQIVGFFGLGGMVVTWSRDAGSDTKVTASSM